MKKTVFGFIIMLISFFVAATILITVYEKAVLTEEARKEAESGLRLMGTFVREAVIRRDYAQVEQAILQWGKERADIQRLSVSADTGLVIGAYTKEKTSPKILTVIHEEKIPGSDKTMILELDQDMIPIFLHIRQIVIRLTITWACLSLFLSICLWWMFNVLSLKPLKKEISARKSAEAALENARDGLETQVEERTAALSKANKELRTEITERKKAKKALITSEQKYRSLVDHAGDAVFITQNGGMKFSNPATVRLTGYSVQELEDMPFIDLIHTDDKKNIQDTYAQSLKGETVPPKSGFRIITKSEKVLWAQINSTRITWEERPAALNFVRDVTDLREMEEQLHQSQKIESIGRLAGGVAHDFNNMLNVITGYSEMALDQLKKSDPLYNDISEILNAANRSAHLTRQLLAFARKQVVSPKMLNLNNVVSGTLRMLQRLTGEDIEIVFHGAAPLWNIYIDPSQVDQVLTNLMINARDAIAGAGHVSIETKNEVLDDAYCAMHSGVSPGEYAMLSVGDTGMGMDNETIENIFEPFFTTKAVGEGTGLGLSTIYGIVKQNNGHINVYSEPEIGSTFRIYFPRYTGGQLKTEGVTESRVIGGNETVLIVEDEPQVLKLAQQTLGKYGYTVLAARLPEEALQIAEQYSKEIHLLVTDVIMPGLNGKELAEKIKAMKPGIKVLFMSGYTENIIAHRGILVEGINFIQKPFYIKPFTQKIREVLDGDNGA